MGVQDHAVQDLVFDARSLGSQTELSRITDAWHLCETKTTEPS